MSCPSCGYEPGVPVPLCGRCGAVMAAAPPRDPPPSAATGDAPNPPAPAVPAAPPAQPYGPPTPWPYPPSPAQAPPEVWLVAVGLLVVAGLILYPVLRYGGPVVPHLFDSNKLARAFASMFVFVFVIIGACGVALVGLAIALVRGSRVGQLLSCVLCLILGIGEIAQSQSTIGPDSTASPASSALIIAACCGAIIVLLTAPPTARRFFGRDQGRPLGVLVAAVGGVYFGACAIVDGLLLLCGVVGTKFVWWGLGLVAAGAGLILANRPLRAARAGARVLASVFYVGFVVLLFVVSAADGGATVSLGSFAPCGAALAALAGLWFAPSSVIHFAQPRALAPLSPIGISGWVSVTVVAVVLAGVGFSSTPTGDAGADAPFTASSFQSSGAPSSGGYAGAPALNASEVQAVAESAFAAMIGTGNVNTCGGDLPTVPIQDYTIDQVSEQTDGSFYVSAAVTLDDDSTEMVSYLVSVDESDQPCVQASSVRTEVLAPPTSAVASAPGDVPSVPAAGDPVPTGAALPGAPADGSVVAYTDDTTTPTTPEQVVEWQPSGLSSDDAAAVQDVIAFMTYVNQQQFQSAWDKSTESLSGTPPSAAFQSGYNTSRFYQVAFGQPQDRADDLIVIPARFVSRQDPAAQGSPSGVTDCTYWPQYLFVVVKSGGVWLDDVAGTDTDRPELAALKRSGSGGTYLNPLAQRVSC